MSDPEVEDDGSAAGADEAAGRMPPIQHCPFCGEHIGSFWGRRDADGATWCESCACFFRVQVG